MLPGKTPHPQVKISDSAGEQAMNEHRREAPTTQGLNGTQGLNRMMCASTMRVWLAGALLVGAGLLAGCGKKSAAAGGPPPAMPVTVVQVKPADVPLTGEWVGT